MNPNFIVVIPTFNAGQKWKRFIEALNSQTIQPRIVYNIDSNSNDQTTSLSLDANFHVVQIPPSQFNHGGTRNLAVRLAKHLVNEIEIVVFLTQDAILNNNYSMANILKPFENARIGAVCGRQLPHSDADVIAQHSRFYNYGHISRLNTFADSRSLGLKAAYMSNSFAAYRYSAYEECGGFPEGLIFGEDMYLAAKMLLNGYSTYYASDATVLHSHNYSIWQESERFFDIGVFHSTQKFLLESFGKPTGQGFKFAVSELEYSWKKGGPAWAINSILRTGFKFLGYHLGKKHGYFPKSLSKLLSMDKNYWNKHEK